MAFETGGSETMLIDILNLQVENLDVSLIIINDIYSEDLLSKIDKRVNIFLLNRKKSSRSILKLISLNFKLLTFQPDIIHLHNPINLRFLFFIKKTVLTMHDMLKIRIENDSNFVHKLEGFDKIVAISSSVKNDILKNGFRKTENLLKIDNGIMVDSISFRNKNNQPVIFKIIQVSRLDHNKKGQHILLEAMRELIHDHQIKNIRLDFIGTGDSKSLLKNLVKEYNIEDYVHFLDFKDRDYIYANLCNYDLFVQPSLFEGFGLTVAEAIAAKIPVLVSNADGPIEIIDNGKYGYFFEIGDSNDCAKKIIEIKEKSVQEITKITESSYERVSENYSIKNTVAKYLSVYKDLLNNQKI
jgi:glycosyltransferase involved in cell wall biosynthesis